MGDPVKIEGGTAVKCNVPVAEAITEEAVLPERVREALGQLIGAAREGLLALSVEVGLGVLRELLEGWVTQRPSRSLVPKHRLALPLRPRDHDAFIIDESAERTVDLDGHRSASNLDELDLGEQAGAVA